jgi:3-deoxy-manno-octulosonate cytidylyltransferase (CMP-KDO synthetase)
LKSIVVIPARYDSSRFCGKVLACDTGKFLVQHTYERVLCAKTVSKVLVAVDSEKVFNACASFGADCVMTSNRHKSGTDRIAEAVKDIDADIVINVQADEPEIDPDCIDTLYRLLESRPDASMATLVTPIKNPAWINDVNVVKTILDINRYAIYFSRLPIPYNRDKKAPEQSLMYRHLGIYAYRKDFLMEITALAQTPLEKCESLEQLRALENGYKIITSVVEHYAEGIDTEEQYKTFVERYKQN